MMFIIRSKNVQKAQGMVEFALVLPILLLVILGIFAFGHLFFVYSSVVSASREAARWGAAVGEAPSAAPRYQDCTSIRAAAVRVGTFAGVNPNTVTINYDHGPVNPPNAPVVFANCPLGGSGPDSSQVTRGDRIVVRITVQYTPIVPFVNLPSFPLSAETGRTIVKSLPVGDAPVAEDPCLTQTEVHITSNPSSSNAVTGQDVFFSATVTALDGTTPTGTVFYSDTDGNARGPVTLSGGSASFPVVNFETASAAGNLMDKTISVRYETDNPQCYVNSADTDYVYTVNKAVTTISIIHPYSISGTGNPIPVTVQIGVDAPGKPTRFGPSGTVTIEINTDGAPKTCTAPIDLVLRTAWCTVTPIRQGLMTIKATYAGDDNFIGDTDQVNHNVVPPETATFLPPPATATPVTPVPTTPPFCPYFESDVLSFSTPPDSVTVPLRNRDSYDLKISRVTVSWPTSGQTAKLKEIRFSDAAGIGTSCGNNSSDQCIWWANNNNQSLLNTNPLNVTSSSSGNWSSSNPGIARNAQRFLYLLFTTDLSQGPYYLTVEFTDNAGHTCTTSPAINYAR